jgi:hypothetical protein
LRPGQRAAEHLRAQQLVGRLLGGSLILLDVSLRILRRLVAGIDR